MKMGILLFFSFILMSYTAYAGESICNLPLETGPCLALFQRYGYNKDSGQCEKFTYGGCKGNANNFETEDECRAACDPDYFCNLPLVTGPCKARMPRFGYDSNLGKCVDFIYGGCKGNKNNFESKDDCEATCNPNYPCTLPLETGPCRASIPRFGYDSKVGKCVDFIYGGCNGNKNNFESKDDCEATCNPNYPCNLPLETGPCRASIPRFGYDNDLGKCVKFVYGGCQGNYNNFVSVDECKVTCDPNCY